MRNSCARLAKERPGEGSSIPRHIETEVARNDFVGHPTTAQNSDKDQLKHKYAASENQTKRLAAKKSITLEVNADYK